MTSHKPENLPNLLSSREAASLLGVRPLTLRKWRCDGTGPRFVRLGTGRRSRAAYRLSDLEAWLEARSFSSTAEEVGCEE
jgi:predicted DNA-binding transcriptional regulator AlpA